MKIFVSWSGPQALIIAESLKTWLPPVLMGKVQLFVSSQDIAKGERALSIVAEGLDSHNYGIVVLTKSNVSAPWIHFEAGALTKSLGKSHVSPVLLDVTDADLVGPLGQFQATALTQKEDVWKLVKDINTVLNEGLPDGSVRVLFDNAWPTLETSIERALDGAVPSTTRSEKEILEEVLDTVRGIARNSNLRDSPAYPSYGPEMGDGTLAKVAAILARSGNEKVRDLPQRTAREKALRHEIKMEEYRHEAMLDAAMEAADDDAASQRD